MSQTRAEAADKQQDENADQYDPQETHVFPF